MHSIFKISEKFVMCSDFIRVVSDQHKMVFKIIDYQKKNDLRKHYNCRGSPVLIFVSLVNFCQRPSSSLFGVNEYIASFLLRSNLTT